MDNKEEAKEFFAKLFIEEFVNSSLQAFDRGRVSRFLTFEDRKEYDFSDKQLDHVKLIVQNCISNSLSNFFFEMSDRQGEFERIKILVDNVDISDGDDLQGDLYGEKGWLGKYFDRNGHLKLLKDEPSLEIDLEEIDRLIQSCQGSLIKARAYWDGDTTGWMLFVEVNYKSDERIESLHLCTLRGAGGDFRLFNGAVPPWPEVEVANRVGEFIKQKYGVEYELESAQPC